MPKRFRILALTRCGGKHLFEIITDGITSTIARKYKLSVLSDTASIAKLVDNFSFLTSQTSLFMTWTWCEKHSYQQFLLKTFTEKKNRKREKFRKLMRFYSSLAALSTAKWNYNKYSSSPLSVKEEKGRKKEKELGIMMLWC